MEITKTHKYFDQMRMVCLCVPKEATRYALNYVEVNEKHIVGTDGHRMACLDNFGLPIGRYKVAKITKTKVEIYIDPDADGNYPKYQDIIPETIREDEKEKIPLMYEMHGLSILHYRIAKKGVCLNISFLKDFMECDTYHVIDKDRPVSFYKENFVAVIRPIDGD